MPGSPCTSGAVLAAAGLGDQHRHRDAWQGYSELKGLGYTREPRSQGAAHAPAVRRDGGKILGVDLMPGLSPLVHIKGPSVHRDSGIPIYG
jgi:hypothetical protein